MGNNGLQWEEDPTYRRSKVTIGGSADTRILYRFYETTAVSSKYLAVVVKELNQEGFILTSYLTDRIHRRRVVWRRVS